MKITRDEITIGYWLIFALVTFVEWSSGKGAEVGLATGMVFTIVYAMAVAIDELRTRWVKRVTEKYRV